MKQEKRLAAESEENVLRKMKKKIKFKIAGVGRRLGRKDDQDPAKDLSGRSKNHAGVRIHHTLCYLTEN